MSEYVFPSEPWLQEYKRLINEDDEYAEKSDGWGDDFNGDYIFEMTDIPVDELDRDALPDEVDQNLEEFVEETDDRGYVGYGFMALSDGGCQEARFVDDPDEVEAGFKLTATTDEWKQLLKGELDPIQGMMSGQLDLQGDMQKMMEYTEGAVRLTEIGSEIDAVFADEEYV